MGNSAGLECPECKSTNTDVINPLAMMSDMWQCKGCQCIFREHYTLYKDGVVTKPGSIEVVKHGSGSAEHPDDVDADCAFINRTGACQYQPKYTFEECGHYGDPECLKVQMRKRRNEA